MLVLLIWVSATWLLWVAFDLKIDRSLCGSCCVCRDWRKAIYWKPKEQVGIMGWLKHNNRLSLWQTWIRRSPGEAQGSPSSMYSSPVEQGCESVIERLALVAFSLELRRTGSRSPNQCTSLPHVILYRQNFYYHCFNSEFSFCHSKLHFVFSIHSLSILPPNAVICPFTPLDLESEGEISLKCRKTEQLLEQEL